eukprot:15330537-Ditylum_brightwellii.AAC.1
MQCDTVNINQQVDVDIKFNAVLGICYEHSTAIPLEFQAVNDMYQIKQHLENGNIHMAKKALLICLGGLNQFSK